MSIPRATGSTPTTRSTTRNVKKLSRLMGLRRASKFWQEEHYESTSHYLIHLDFCGSRRDCLATHFRFASSDRARLVFPLLLTGPNVLQLLVHLRAVLVFTVSLSMPLLQFSNSLNRGE